MSSPDGGTDEGFRRRANTGGLVEEASGTDRWQTRGGLSNTASKHSANEVGGAAFWYMKDRHRIPEPIRSHFMPPRTCIQWRDFLFRHLPFLHLLWTYRLKFIIGDLIAGVTIGVTHIPQGIGFALLANLPVQYGLYSSFMPPLIYTLLGTSKHISIGTFPVVSLMVGEAVQRLTGAAGCVDPNLGSVDSALFGGQVNCTDIAQDTAITLSLLAGVVMIVFGILQFGFITLFLSDALISGYTCAAAFTILLTQVRAMLGLPREITPGQFQNIRRMILYFHDFVICGAHNNAAIVFAVLSVVFLLSTDVVNRLLNKYVRPKLKGIPVIIPAQIILVIVATGISFGIRPPQEDESNPVGVGNLSITGVIPEDGLPVTFNRIRPSLMAQLVMDAVVIAIISYVINVSQAKLFSKKSGYKIDSNQEFLAYGSMNLVGSFFGSFPTAGALSRTVLQHTLGGNTQLVSVLSSIIVLITLLALTFLFTFLPIPTLAAIIATALLGLYLQIFDLKRFFKNSFIDGCIWIVVFSATFIIGLEIGLLIGVVFSLAVVVVYTILPSSGQLGWAEDWDPERWRFTKVTPLKGIFIFRFEAPVYFLNAAVFRSQLVRGCGVDPAAFQAKEEEGMLSVCFKKLRKIERRNDVVYDTDERSDVRPPSRAAGNSAYVDGTLTPPSLRSPSNQIDHNFITTSGEIKQKSPSPSPRTTARPPNTRFSRSTSLPPLAESSPRTSSHPASRANGEATGAEGRREDGDEGGTPQVGEENGKGDGGTTKPRFLPFVGIHDDKGYEAAQQKYAAMPGQWKANIAAHGHVLRYHTLVLDCSAVHFVDAAGAEALYQLISEYDELSIQVLLARPNAYLIQLLKRLGFFDIFGPGWIFPSLDEAVRYAKAGNRVRNQFVQESLDLRFMTLVEKQAFQLSRFDPIDAVQQIARRFSNPAGMRRPSLAGPTPAHTPATPTQPAPSLGSPGATALPTSPELPPQGESMV